MDKATLQQIRQAYIRMAEEACCRPAAPAGEIGNRFAPQSEIESEAAAYAWRWDIKENYMSYAVGRPHWAIRQAFIWIIEAARLACGEPPFDAARISKLLEMARVEITKLAQQEVSRD